MRALLFGAAALSEILGSYLVWQAIRLGQPWLWLPGIVVLALFAWFLAQTGNDSAGRVFAAYGGVYIVASMGFMLLVEKVRPDMWDIAGLLLCLAGAAVIYFGPRSA